MEDYLPLEYEQCLAQVNYYDGRQSELIRHFTVLACGSPLFLFLSMQLGDPGSAVQWDYIAATTALLFLALSTLYVLYVGSVEGRLGAARQALALRSRLVAGRMLGGPRALEQLATYNWADRQSLLNGLLAVQLGFYAWGFTFATKSMLGHQAAVSSKSAMVGVVMGLVVFLWSSFHLMGKALSTGGKME